MLAHGGGIEMYVNLQKYSEEKAVMKNTLQVLVVEMLSYNLSFRLPMRVTELRVYHSFFGSTGYYKCPRCRITMEREFMAYCDRCGQRLDWDDYENVRIIDL